jgi:hypothetical protein
MILCIGLNTKSRSVSKVSNPRSLIHRYFASGSITTKQPMSRSRSRCRIASYITSHSRSGAEGKAR